MRRPPIDYYQDYYDDYYYDYDYDYDQVSIVMMAMAKMALEMHVASTGGVVPGVVLSVVQGYKHNMKTSMTLTMLACLTVRGQPEGVFRAGWRSLARPQEEETFLLLLGRLTTGLCAHHHVPAKPTLEF